MADETKPAGNGGAEDRADRQVLVGTVTRDKMNKTRRVEIARLVKHPRYSKYLRRRTVCYVHDENNETRNGDQVEIMETRPLSKMKNWRLVRIITRAPRAAEPAAKAAGEKKPG